MEPKDLKNPDGSKSTAKKNLKKAEEKILSDKEKIVKNAKKSEETAIESSAASEENIIKAEEKIEDAKPEINQVVNEVEDKAETEIEEATDVAAKEEEVKDVEESAVSEHAEKDAAENITVEEKSTEVVAENEGLEEKKDESVKPVKKNKPEEVKADVEEESVIQKKKKEEVADKEEVTEEKETKKKVEETGEKDSKENNEENVAEKEDQQPEKGKEKVDYSKYAQIDLVNALRDILDNYDNNDIKQEVETIKAVFYKNFNENVVKQRKKFIDEGGAEEDFKVEADPYENDIKDLLKRYRHIRIEFNKKLEVEKEENLKLKYEVIEEIKGLINNEESINKTFHEFRELQRRWREIGLVPQSKMKNLWDTYHFHVENFYDYIKINRELRDLDLKKNLEAKIGLCERAEELLIEPSIIKAFNTLQKYHEQWREIGPVPIEQKDDIWERFKAATTKINRKHQEFFENRKVDQKKNLEAKIALCEKVEEINVDEITNHREWDKRSRELVELQKVWRTIGFAPRKDNNKIYERFRSACDRFFDAKRDFYSKNKELQQNNLQLKTDLCVQAESLKDSTDWKKTTQDFINIQKKWKEIGPVPRKHSDNIWKRFRAACDFFFEKKAEHFSSIDSEQDDNLKKKEELIVEVGNFKPSEDVDENLKSLKNFQRRWSEIGHVPIKSKDEIQARFRDAIDKLFDDLNIDESKRNLLKFKSKMSSFSESTRGQNKMRMEREKYMNKLKQLENDLVLLDNNIGFFAKSKNAETLIADIKKKTEITRQKIEFLKNKIRVIDDMDKSEE